MTKKMMDFTQAVRCGMTFEYVNVSLTLENDGSVTMLHNGEFRANIPPDGIEQFARDYPSVVKLLE